MNLKVILRIAFTLGYLLWGGLLLIALFYLFTYNGIGNYFQFNSTKVIAIEVKEQEGITLLNYSYLVNDKIFNN